MKQFFSTLCLLAFLCCFFQPELLSQNTKCATCGKLIRAGSKFLKSSDNRIFCCQACYEKTLPKCSICGKRLTGGYLKGSDSKLYCSEKCISTTWPLCSGCGVKSQKGAIISCENGDIFFCEKCLSLPRCFCCGLPAKCQRLEDGRMICDKCLKDAVSDYCDAISLFEEVRALMRDKLMLSTTHKISYKLVDQEELEKISPQEQHGRELGLFRCVEEIETITTTRGTKKTTKQNITRNYEIFLISHMNKRKFLEVAAHELGHDWMQEYYPRINDLAIKEGWAQYVAWRVNTIYKQKGLNTLLENNKDPIYGDGFRMIRDLSLKTLSPMDSLHAFFRSNASEKNISP